MVSLVSVACLTACKSIEQGEDPFVVGVERTEKIGLPAVDGFLKWEYENRATAPEFVKSAAKSVRSKAKDVFISLDRVRVGYKAGTETKNTLVKWLDRAVLVIEEARIWQQKTSASEAGGGSTDIASALIADAEQHQAMKGQLTTESIAGVLGIIGAIKDVVLPLVMEARDAMSQTRAMTADEDAAFRRHLVQTVNQKHWQ